MTASHLAHIACRERVRRISFSAKMMFREGRYAISLLKDAITPT